MQDAVREEKTLFRKRKTINLSEKLVKEDFRIIIRKGNRYRGKYLKAVYRTNKLNCARLGFSVSAKAGNAVKRNLFRRRVKQLFRENTTLKKKEIDIIVFPVGKLEHSSYKGLKEDVKKLSKVFTE